MAYQRSRFRSCTLMVVVVTVLIGLTDSQLTTVQTATDVYLNTLLDQYGSNRSLSIEELSGLLHTSRHADSYPADSAVPPVCNWTRVKWTTTLPECATSKCLSAVDMFAVQKRKHTESLTKSELLALSPLLLYEVQKKNCPSSEEEKHIQTHFEPPTKAETWGYGFLCVSIINILPFSGALLLPIMKTKLYKYVITWMVGLAVGTLTASAVIILIPKAWGLISSDVTVDPTPRVMRSLTVLGGLYMFFLLERFLKFVMEIRKRRHHENGNKNKGHHLGNDLPLSSISGPRHTQCMEDVSHLRAPPSFVHNPSFGKDVYDQEVTVSVNNNTTPEKNVSSTREISEKQPHGKIQTSEVEHNHDHSHGDGDIASVAWMIIVGDGLHNFVDGLSIGAAFTDSLMSGISVSVAVACEELPHELGDFAILITSGMSVKRALGYNFLSACTCYFGLIAGILLGENTKSTDWIFAIAGGMFLYIALVDMTPEMNITAEEVEKQKETVCDIQVFVLQHFGILLGAGIMTVMALYEHNIDFT